MIAFALAETGRRPGVADRRSGAAARRQRRAPERAGSSSRATSPTARSSRCRPRSRSSRTSSSTTTASSRSLAELDGEFDRWTGDGCARRARRAALRGAARACRASTTAATRARRSPRSSSPASRATRRRRRSRASRGTGRRFEVLRGRGGVTIVDDYAPPPDRDRGDDRGRARGLPGPPPARALPAAPRLAHPPPRARARRRARRRGRRRRHRRLPGPRERRPGGHRQARRRRALRPRPARLPGCPRLEQAAEYLARAGTSRRRRCSSLGAGDVDRAPGDRSGPGWRGR